MADEYVGEGKIVLGNSADLAASYITSPSGVLVLGSSAASNLVFSYVGSGGLRAGNTSPAALTTRWTNTFTWAVSQGVMRTFRVEGKCRPAKQPCPPTYNPTPSCPAGSTMQYVANVQARSVTDLCKKLKSSGFLGPIKKIQRWSLPANKSDWSSTDSADCNSLADVSFSSIPDCLDFTVDADVSVNIGFAAEAVLESEFSYQASGSLTVGGSCTSRSSVYSYVGSGFINFMPTEATTESPQCFLYVSQGGLGLGNSATAYGSDYGSRESVMAMAAVVADLSVVYGTVAATTLTASNDQISASCCTSFNLPQILFITHELHRSERLSNFLSINGFTFSRVLKMMYSRNTDSWYTNVHFKGNSVNNNQRESWNIIFEFGCLTEDAVLGLPENTWGLMISLQVRNLTTSRLDNTRLVMEFDPTDVCGVSDSLRLPISFNTKTLKTIPSVVRTAVFSDGVGAFRGNTYLRNPATLFEVGSSAVSPGVGMLNQSAKFRKVLASVL